MRRLLRILLNAATAVSLVLGVATVVLGVGSFWRRYDVSLFAPDGRCFTLALYRGGCYAWREAALSGRWQFTHSSLPADAHAALEHQDFSFAGFGYTGEPQSSKGWGLRLWRVPTWSLAAGLAVTCRFLVRKRRRPPAGVCVNCGYDLRATPERCPECGTMRQAPVS